MERTGGRCTTMPPKKYGIEAGLPQLHGVNVISLVGRQGSGKSTVGSMIAKELNLSHIETSDTVKKHVNNAKRSELPKTGRFTKDNNIWLAKPVAIELVKALKDKAKNSIILTGVREVEVHQYLERIGANIHAIEMQAYPEVRFDRLVSGKKVSSASEFLEHEIAESALGVQKVIDGASFVARTRADKRPLSIVLGIIKRLREKEIL